MPTAATTNANMDDVFATWINKRFISDLTFQLQYQKFTTDLELPNGAAANIGRFVDWAPPLATGTGYTAGGSTSISEGNVTANEITQVTTTPTNVTVAEFGEFIKTTRLWELAAVSGSRERLAKRIRDGGLVSIDSVVRTQASTTGTASAIYATTASTGGQTTAATPTTAGAALIMLARKTLFAGLATGISGVAGHPDGQFAAIISPKQELDIVTEVSTSRVYWNNAVVNVAGSMGQLKWVNGYIGSIYGTAVYTTQNFGTATITSASDIGFVLADGGLAAVAFEDMNANVVINDVNSPYKNINSIAWHAYFGAGLVSSARVVKLYSLS